MAVSKVVRLMPLAWASVHKSARKAETDCSWARAGTARKISAAATARQIRVMTEGISHVTAGTPTPRRDGLFVRQSRAPAGPRVRPPVRFAQSAPGHRSRPEWDPEAKRSGCDH